MLQEKIQNPHWNPNPTALTSDLSAFSQPFCWKYLILFLHLIPQIASKVEKAHGKQTSSPLSAHNQSRWAKETKPTQLSAVSNATHIISSWHSCLLLSKGTQDHHNFSSPANPKLGSRILLSAAKIKATHPASS